MAIRLPSDKDRIVILGRTGTGKTVAGLWHLSNFDVTNKPWIVINFKNDEHIDSIERAQHVDFDFVPGKKDCGLFVIHPLPQDAKGTTKEKSPLETYLWKLWSREDIGIFCDEGFLVGSNEAFDAIQTQGRSKRIPCITCSQRPVWISRFAFSEASFIQTFHLNDDRDRDTITGFTPLDEDDFDALKEYQSFYYDVSQNELTLFNPVPNMDEIRKVFESKLPRKRVRI